MNALKMTFLMTFLTVIVVKVGRALGGAEGALIALMIALVVHAINYWFIDKIILRMHGAKSNMPGTDAHAQILFASPTDGDCLCHRQRREACRSGGYRGHPNPR